MGWVLWLLNEAQMKERIRMATKLSDLGLGDEEWFNNVIMADEALVYSRVQSRTKTRMRQAEARHA